LLYFSRDPLSIVNHKCERKEMTEQEKEELLAKTTPKAVRNIFLVRHGQYFDQEDEKDARKLTPLGINLIVLGEFLLWVVNRSLNREWARF